MAWIFAPAIVACVCLGCASPDAQSERAADVAARAQGGATQDSAPDTAELTPEAFIAEQQLADDGSGGQGDDVVCRWERPLGSHIRKRVCKTEVERQRDEIEARHLMKTRQEVMRQ